MTITTAQPDIPKGTKQSLMDLVRSFTRNIFGSDATVAYTAEYAWLANQMSHMLLGFFIGVVWILKVTSWSWHPATMALIFLLPIVKDAIDYAMDTWRGSGPFAINKRELILDWVTDDCYWGIGMVVAIVLIGIDGTMIGNIWFIRIGVFLACGALAVYLAFGLWVPQKRRFDFSRMPFNFVRLIKYPDPESLLSEESRRELRAFQDHVRDHEKTASSSKHYLLVGGRPIVRSGLAVSMGCEYIARWKGVYMIPAVKVLEDPERMRHHCAMAKEYKADVFCLIIDDLSVNLPIPEETDQEPAKARKEMRQKSMPDSLESRQEIKLLHFVEVFGYLKKTFPYVTTIWVASANPNEPAEVERLKKWSEFIAKLAGGPLTTIDVLDNSPYIQTAKRTAP